MSFSILIVENDWLQAESLQTVLGLAGHVVCGVSASGERAVALAAALRPDVVVMDVWLDGRIDGIESAARIAQTRPGCGVVFITGYADSNSMARMKAIEHATVIAKPATEDDIIGAIARMAPRLRKAADHR